MKLFSWLLITEYKQEIITVRRGKGLWATVLNTRSPESQTDEHHNLAVARTSHAQRAKEM